MGFQKDVLYALGFLADAVIGDGPAVSGLVCAPTAPPSLNVTIGAGSIYATEPVDSTAYGALGTDTNNIVKQGLLESPATLAISPPTTSGYSQVYLVEVAYNDADTDPITLPYYNAANPSQPLNGPNNSGTQQPTVRVGECVIALKAGAAAPTGTQVPPAVDAGYSALYTIVVTNGQTTITSSSISVSSSAVFIPLTLPQVPRAIQQQKGNWSTDAGSGNNLSITLTGSQAPTAGEPIRIKKGNTANTGAMNVTIVNVGTYSVLWEDGSQFAGDDWPANAVGDGIFDGTVFRMSGPNGPLIWGNHAPAAPSVPSTSDTYNNLITNFPSILPPRNILLSQIVGGSGNITVPAGITEIFFRMVGAGGGGGPGGAGGFSQFSGGGGGSGGYSEGWITVTPGQVLAWVVGGGGAGATANGTAGGTGGTSIFGGANCTGGGGGILSFGGGSTTASGGTYGVGSGGQLNLPGANGGDGNPSVALIQGGSGASSAFGGGGRTSTVGLPSRGDVVNGIAPGSGGGGVWGTGTGNQQGGRGADGGLIIYC
jgi:hypothetical protein